MSPSPTTLTAPAATGSRYQLDLAQVQKASTALLAHIKSVSKEKALLSGKQDLFAPTATTSLTSSSVVDDDVDDSPVWLVLTTKKHVTDKTRLKPTKMFVSPQSFALIQQS